MGHKDKEEVRIFTDSGRLLRPLLVVENLQKLKQKKPEQRLLDQGVVELIGIEEEEDCHTAWGIKQLLREPKNYTHCELDMSFLLGVSCAIVPFGNHYHAFPSRQTPGQLLEAALSKGIASTTKTKDKPADYTKLIRHATPFSTPSVDEITEQLHRAGFSKWGNEKVYNGRTGEGMRSLVFMGPTFYQRLVHMAEDKVKFRNTGAVHPLTRQPVADKKRFGGIKFGEMERDCLIAHGASSNLHERLFTLSDSSQMHVCRKCKNVANVIERTASNGKKIRGPYCRLCQSTDDLVRIYVPYGAKLLGQELFSMGINLKFDTKLC